MIAYCIRDRRQRGAVLIVALILLASLTLIAVSGVDSATMSLRVSRNVEEQMNAFQTAHAAIDFIISDSANLPMIGALNTPSAVALVGSPFSVNVSAGETFSAEAVRTTDCGLPPRLSSGTSMLAYSAFSFRVAADINRLSTGRGQSSQRQGQIILGPKC